MPIYDLSPDDLDQLRGMARREPADFDAFWDKTLQEVRQHQLHPVLTPVDNELRTVRTYAITFAGWAGEPISGWLLRPGRDEDERHMAIVEFVGYGGGRGLPHEWLTWPSAGYPYLVVDARGQGSGYRTGVTPDLGATGATQSPGFLTRGIGSPEDYYYRRAYSDAVRAVEAIRALPGIEIAQVATVGTSQGGGLAIAAAALASDVAALVAAVPFPCDFRRGAEMAPQGPFTEIAAYCAQRPDEVGQVFETLSYFDAVHLARRCTMPSLWSVALMDELAPPATVLAAHRACGSLAERRIHPFAGHEDARGEQTNDALRFLSQLSQNRS